MRVFCSICKEIFIPYSEVKVTNCGHLYHGTCISRWTKQHRTCPQCRSNLIAPPFRVFFDVEKDNGTDPSALEHQIEVLSDKIRENEVSIKAYQKEKESCETIMEDMKKCALALKQKNDSLKTSVSALKEQVSQLLRQNKEVERLKKEVEKLNNKLRELQNIELILNGSSEEVTKMLESTTYSELALKQVCTFAGVLKTQFQKSEAKNMKLYKENKDLSRNLHDEKRKNSANSEEVVSNLKSAYSNLEKELFRLRKMVAHYSKKDVVNNSTYKPLSQTSANKPVFNMDPDLIEELEDEKSKEVITIDDCSKTINHWEDIVCAGPSRNYARPLSKSKSLNVHAHNHNDGISTSRNESSYAFDGMGGRKKIRLGGPTPIEEFKNIKKTDDKKSVPTFKHKKIIHYCQLN